MQTALISPYLSAGRLTLITECYYHRTSLHIQTSCKQPSTRTSSLLIVTPLSQAPMLRSVRLSVCLSHLCVCHTPCGPWTTNCLYCLLSPSNVTSSGSATPVQSVTSSARLVDESHACIPALFHFVEMDITLHGQSTVVAGV